MRVLVVTPWFPRHGDGAGSFVEDQVRAIAARHEVAVLHLAESAPEAVQVEPGENWRVVRCSASVPNRPGFFAVRDLASALAGSRRLRQMGFRPEIVHAHVFSAALAALPSSRRDRAPLVVSEHLSNLARGQLSRRSRVLAALAYRRADLVCPVSDSLRGPVQGIAPSAHITVVPNPVDERLFGPAQGDERRGHVRALVVASLLPVKGIASLVDAVGLLAARRRDFAVKIVGDGPLLGELRSRVQAASLDGLIDLSGRLPRPEVARELRRCDLLVVPSEWETFSVVAAEALMSGVPVLGTRVGGLPELIDDSNGLLVEPDRTPALAAGLEKMLDTARSYDRVAIAAAARERVGSGRVAETWSKLYGELVAGRSASKLRPAS